MARVQALVPARTTALILAAVTAVGGFAAFVSTCPGADADSAAAPRIDFATTTKFSVNVQNSPSSTLWKRELMRQSLLLAARAELNYSTADNGLGDGISRSRPSIELACVAGSPNRIQVLLGNSAKREQVWAHEFKFDSRWPHHRAWIERMEVMSRTSFVEALERAKFPRRPKVVAKSPASQLDAELTRLIDEELSFVGQFLALRQLHEEVSRDGETASRLAGLVRAYSHLGVLTEYQWHPMSYAFKARALLYAQRWAAREPKSKAALQHRAYAFALVGMHGEALTDLQAARKLPVAAQGQTQSPAWVPLIEHFCRYEFEKLNQLRSDDRVKPLASLLFFLALEQEGSKNQVVTVGMQLMKDMPGCYRMLDTLCHHTGPGAGQITTQAGPLHLATTLLPRMSKVEGLPKHIREALNDAKAAGALLTEEPDQQSLVAEIEHRTRLIRALRGVPPDGSPAPVPDGTEPSWPVLAKVIEETTFLQVYRRAFFLRNQIGVPVDGYIDAYRPLVGSHRHFVLVNQMHASSRETAGAVQSLGATYLDFAHARIWVYWPRELQLKVEEIAKTHKEALPNEQGLAARSYHYDVNVGPGPLLAVSPHSPYAMGVALRVNYGPLPEEKEWEEVAKRSPYLAWSFAEVWTMRGDRAKAERFLKLAAELDPSPDNYRKLANHYKAQGDEKNWLKAMDDCLKKSPNLDLAHAQIQCEIAQYHCGRREWDKALPYADAAGETGAQWAMSWARLVNEANQNWDEAEELLVAAVQRYGEHPFEWYSFCQRNGVGNLGLARESAFPEGVDAFAAIPNVPANYAGMALYLEGKPSKALEVYEKESDSAPASWSAMMAATLADKVGENAKRDMLLKRVIEQRAPSESKNDLRPHRDELIELARQFVADLAAGGKCSLDFAKLHTSRDKAPDRDRCSFNFFLASYLDRHGKPDAGTEYWKACMGASDLFMSTRTAAGFELHKRGVKPADWKDRLFAKPGSSK